MKKFAIPILLFAAVVSGGGIYGFIKADSTPSLVMALSFGLVLFISGVYIRKEKIFFLYVATYCILILHFFFLYRFLKTFKIMPAGMMVLLSTVVGAPLFSYLTKRVKESIYLK